MFEIKIIQENGIITGISIGPYIGIIGHLNNYICYSDLFSTSLKNYSTGFPLLGLLNFVYTLREINYTYGSMISAILGNIILSEGILFCSYFYGFLSESCNLNEVLTKFEGLLESSENEFVLVITLLLVVICMLNTFYSRVLIVFCGYLFLTSQVCEYISSSLYLNDNIFGEYFFTITGLHFLHVLVGIILISFPFENSNSIYSNTEKTHVEVSKDSIYMAYLHFSEVIWVIILIIFYS